MSTTTTSATRSDGGALWSPDIHERTYSAASYTSGSMVSLVSGLMPGRHRVRDFDRRLSPEVKILPDYLSELESAEHAAAPHFRWLH